MVRGNLTWLALNLPVSALIVLLLLPFADLGGAGVFPLWPLLLGVAAPLLLPTPAGFGLGALAAAQAGREAPQFAAFARAVRLFWKRGVALLAIGILGCAVGVANIVFYLSLSSGWLKLVSILWLYLLLFWVALQVYLVPLALHRPRANVRGLYRRAALVTLAHPVFTLALLFASTVVVGLSLLILPLYPLLSAAYLALLHAWAFRELRQRHGDLTDEETA